MQPERSVGFLIDEVGTIEMVDVVSVDETVDAVCGGYVQVLCLFVVLEEPVPSFTQIGKKIPVAYGMLKAEIICAFSLTYEPGGSDKCTVLYLHGNQGAQRIVA